MNNLIKVKRKIQLEFPEFVIEKIEKIGEGMDSVAYLLNDCFIFRFPKDISVRQNLAKEIAALPILQPKLNIKIPNFEFIGFENSFVGYKQIEGEFLTKDFFVSFSKNEQKNILKMLAEFLTAIHRQSINKFTKCGIKIEDFRANYQTDFEDARKFIFPIITDDDKEFITKQFRQYLETNENFAYQPALLHNDFRVEHILVDAKTKQVSGIIDFGDIGIGDADYDLVYLVEDYGEDFIRALLKFYPHPNQENLFRKLYFWTMVDILQMIVHYSENKESDKIEEWKTNLLRWIRIMKEKTLD